MADKRVFYAAVALLVQCLAGCSDEITPAPRESTTNASAAVAPQGDAALVLAFGDSLYAGYGLQQNESFPAQLEAMLKAQGHQVRVINAGVSGDTTAAGLARLQFTLDGLDRAPDLVLVGLGGNDMLRGLSPEATRANLTAILDTLAKRKIRLVLTGMLAAPNLGADYARQFNPIYADLARRYGATLDPFFLDGVAAQPDFILADGLHPNAQGVALITKRLAPIVVKALEGEAKAK